MAARQPLGAITDIGPSVPVTIAHGGAYCFSFWSFGIPKLLDKYEMSSLLRCISGNL